MCLTHFVPKLRHFRCPGINLFVDVAACNRKEPPEALAGERFNDAMAAASTTTDSLELQLEEVGGGDGGSSFKDNLK